MEKENRILKLLFSIYLFLIPFFLGSLDLFYPSIFLIFLLIIFSIFLLKQIEDEKIEFFIPFNFILFLLFLSICFFSTSNFFETRNEFLKNLIYFFTFFLVLNLFSKKDLKKILKILFVSSIFISLYGIIFYILLENPDYLIFSTFFNPNCLANYIIMILPFSYFLLKEEKEFLKKEIIFLGIILITLSLFLTGSRGAIFSLLISLLFLFILKKQFLKEKFIVFSLLLIFSGGIGLFYTKPILRERAINFFNLQHRSQLFRFLVWKGTLKIIRENPFLGTGPGTFKVVYPKYKLGGSNTQMAHNTYLQIASETGILGFFFFLFLIISHLKKIFSEEENIVISSSLLSFLIHNLFDYSYYIPANATIFWILAGCLNLKEGKFFKKIHKTDLQKILIYLFSISILFIFTNYILKIGIGNFYYEKGKNFEYEKNYKEAEKYYKKAVYLDPLSDKYFYELAGILGIQGKFKEAEKFYQKSIRIFEESPYSHHELGIVYLKQGKFKNAEEEFKKAISLSPNFTSPHKELGNMYIFLGKIEIAKKEFKKILKLKENPYNQEKYEPIPGRGENPDFIYAKNMLKLIEEIKKSGRYSP